VSVPEGRKLAASGERQRTRRYADNGMTKPRRADRKTAPDRILPALRGSPDRYTPFRGFASGSPPATSSGPLRGFAIAPNRIAEISHASPPAHPRLSAQGPSGASRSPRTASPKFLMLRLRLTPGYRLRAPPGLRDRPEPHRRNFSCFASGSPPAIRSGPLRGRIGRKAAQAIVSRVAIVVG